MHNAILTDANGKPFQKPQRADYSDTVDYIRAVHVYNDAVSACANDAFDKAFSKGLK